MASVKRRGFTLLEVLIAITIVLTVVLATWANRNDDPLILQNTAEEIASAIRYARRCYDAGDNSAYFQIARSEGRYYFRVYESGPRMTINIPIDPSIKIATGAFAEDRSDEVVNEYASLGDYPLTIKFANGTGSGTAILLSSKTVRAQYKITVVPISSRVHVYTLTD